MPKNFNKQKLNKESVSNPRTLVMELETYRYFKQQDREQEQHYIENITRGVEGGIRLA